MTELWPYLRTTQCDYAIERMLQPYCSIACDFRQILLVKHPHADEFGRHNVFALVKVNEYLVQGTVN